MSLLADLRYRGLRLTRHAGQLLIGPVNVLTDADRAMIRVHRTAILAELAAETQADIVGLADFRHALQMGMLVVCGNCRHFGFAADPDAGRCQRFEVEAAAFVPFPCAGFEPGRNPAVRDYLPDPVSGPTWEDPR